MEKTQKEYYLNEQMKAIQKELGESEDLDEISELENKINDYSLSKEAKEKCKSEIKKLKSMSPMSAEATVIRNYLDWSYQYHGIKKIKYRRILRMLLLSLRMITMVFKKLKIEF